MHWNIFIIDKKRILRKWKGYYLQLNGLYALGKLSDFEYNQLVCLNSIMSSLVGIEDYLSSISQSLSNIKGKEIDEDLIRGER